MEFRNIGPSEVRVPVIGLGTWKYSAGIKPLHAGIDQGACFIDTAEIYGTEEIVGKAIKGRRDRVFVATKVAPRNFRRNDLVVAAENSLRRLDTDYIDLYQLHWPNDTVPIGESTAAMESLVEAGKVRFIGVSNFSVRDLKGAQAALSTRHRIVSNQLRYNLIERTVEESLLDYCKQNNVTIIAHSPLGSSLLRIRAADPEGVLADIANAACRTEAQVALNWLLAKNDNVLAIPKASTVQHAIEDCGAAGWRLSREDYDLLDTRIRFKRRGRVESAARRCVRHIRQLFGRQL
jgi:diketogulonate reductase-like aldo/keto reductase